LSSIENENLPTIAPGVFGLIVPHPASTNPGVNRSSASFQDRNRAGDAVFGPDLFPQARRTFAHCGIGHGGMNCFRQPVGGQAPSGDRPRADPQRMNPSSPEWLIAEERCRHRRDARP
jgi:hypothetical protein